MIKENKIIFANWMQVLLKIIIVISTAFLTILLSNRYEEKHILVGAILSLCISIILMLKVFKIKEVNIKRLVVATFVSLYIIKNLLLFSYTNISLFECIFKNVFNITLETTTIQKLLGIMAIPSTIFFVYIFLKKISPILKRFKSSLTNGEKNYLVLTTVASIIITLFTIISTTAFSKPIFRNNLILYDVLYTTDSGAISANDAYFNVSNYENDVRQPLFGIFALPFSVIAKLISEFCFFLPNGYAYETIFTIIQFILVSISTILIGRMLKLEEKDKKYLYLLFSLSFTYLLFSLILEQYVISLFYLILALYIAHINKDKINYMYIGAVGTLLTSGIIFPAITKTTNNKKYVKDILKCFSAFMSLLIIGGQFPQILTIVSRFKFLRRYSGTLPFYDKFCQFTYFVQGLFKPVSGELGAINGHPAYLLPEINTISILGVIIIVMVIISLILNRKNKMARIAFLWTIFSFIILCIIGWGTAENGLVLYSLYFAFAYYILYFLLIKKICKNRKAFEAVMIATIVIILFFNIQEFSNILRFTLTYY